MTPKDKHYGSCMAGKQREVKTGSVEKTVQQWLLSAIYTAVRDNDLL